MKVTEPLILGLVPTDQRVAVGSADLMDLNSRDAIIIVTMPESTSAQGPEYIMPSMPNICGSRSKAGRKNMICLVRERNIPLRGFPIDVKKVDVMGWMELSHVKKRNMRMKRMPKVKYSSDSLPKSPIISRGKVWNMINAITANTDPAMMASLNA